MQMTTETDYNCDCVRGGSDHRINDFPGYESPEWLAKQKLAKEARSAFKGKVIAVYTSLFFEVGFVNPIRMSPLRSSLFIAGPAPDRPRSRHRYQEQRVCGVRLCRPAHLVDLFGGRRTLCRAACDPRDQRAHGGVRP